MEKREFFAITPLCNHTRRIAENIAQAHRAAVLEALVRDNRNRARRSRQALARLGHDRRIFRVGLRRYDDDVALLVLGVGDAGSQQQRAEQGARDDFVHVHSLMARLSARYRSPR